MNEKHNKGDNVNQKSPVIIHKDTKLNHALRSEKIWREKTPSN